MINNPKMCEIKLVRVGEYPEEYRLVPGHNYSVGRAKNNDIICNTLIVSRKQCIIHVDDSGTVTVEHVGGSNATYINDKKLNLNEPQIVRDNQKIGLAVTEDLQVPSLTNEAERYVYKLVKVEPQDNTLESTKIISLEDDKENKYFKKYEFEDDIIILDDRSDDELGSQLNQLNVREPSYAEHASDKYDVQHVIPSDEEDDIFLFKEERIDDDPIVLVDSDSESERWFTRLSQSSPGKSLQESPESKPLKQKCRNILQFEDFSENEEAENNKNQSYYDDIDEDDIFILSKTKDQVDGIPPTSYTSIQESATTGKISISANKMAILLNETATTVNKRRTISSPITSGPLKKKAKFERLSKRELNKNKEERRKRLRDLANKKTDESKHEKKLSSSPDIIKPVGIAKVTRTNRGQCLAEEIEKPVKKLKSLTNKNTSKQIRRESKSNDEIFHESDDNNKVIKDIEHIEGVIQKEIAIVNELSNTANLKSCSNNQVTVMEADSSQKDAIQGAGNKKKKTVRFSLEPQIKVFEIDSGNNMKPTSLCSINLRYIKPAPILTADRYMLQIILKWSVKWLKEQVNQREPPPILPHSNPPSNIMHSFSNHQQYTQIFLDLLLMEVWEILTQGFLKKNSKSNELTMQVESVPVVIMDKSNGPVEFNVNLSLPKNKATQVPRVGDLLAINVGGSNEQPSYFFYVQNVKTLPSPQQNVNMFYTITLTAMFTEKMTYLKPGDLLLGRSLAFIKNELQLMEAIDELRSSLLCRVILRPEPIHFTVTDFPLKLCQWTENLNPSQREAVRRTVNVTLHDIPAINMVQGPPGTGKTRVICSMVMQCLYDEHGTRRNKHKLLVCATSNAAVDDLLIRLLEIRQSLPKLHRFRMVRVGREDSMHARAIDISSMMLAKRTISKQQRHTAKQPFDQSEELSCLEAKVNSWKSAANTTTDQARLAYCLDRYNHYRNRLQQMQGGKFSIDNNENLVNTERTIIEGADIIMTTLSSAGSAKLKCLKGRISLCIVDEAGQAIEPDTLVPLTLQIPRITLVGDPQQLPGFICSQRAKNHGLCESLFSRLLSYTEDWEQNPVVLLDTQYRMHPSIADYPCRVFYGGRVKTQVNIRNDLPIASYKLLYVSTGDKGQESSGANTLEAWCVVRVVLSIRAAVTSCSIAVVTPYAAHKHHISDLIKKAIGKDELPVEVNTLDSFQGQERDIIIVSLARSQGVGFLSHAGRLNVLLTRAKHSLLICMNPYPLSKNPLWRTLMEDAKTRKAFEYMPNNFCYPVTSQDLNTEDVLRYLK